MSVEPILLLSLIVFIPGYPLPLFTGVPFSELLTLCKIDVLLKSRLILLFWRMLWFSLLALVEPLEVDLNSFRFFLEFTCLGIALVGFFCLA
jgi:hypothetical protein